MPPPDIDFALREWGTKVEFNDNAYGNYIPDVAADAQGNAIVVWFRQETSNSSYEVWGRRYANGPGWYGAQFLDYGSYPRIAMDAEGNAIVVYQTGSGITAIRYDVQAGWGEPQLIEDLPTTVVEPVIALNGGGDGFAVLQEAGGGVLAPNGDTTRIYVVRHLAASGWGDPEQIGSSGVKCRDANIAVNGSGEAVLAWEEGPVEGGPADVYVATFDGGAWGPPVLVEQYDGNAGGEFLESNRSGPKVGIDAAGIAFAVWLQDGETVWGENEWSLWASRFEPGSGWGSPFPLESEEGICRRPQIFVTPAGSSMVMWDEGDQIWAAYFDGQGSWSDPVALGAGIRPTVAGDSEGNFVATWQSTYVMAAAFVAGEGWQAEEALAVFYIYGLYPIVAMGENGIATVAWQQYAGNDIWEIWTNRRE